MPCEPVVTKAFCSGFYVLVKGKLAILTNNHVLPDKKAASIAVAVFQTANMGTVEVALYPQKLWYTSPKEELDYSLVACEVPQGVQPVELVRCALPEVEPGDTIIIVQHPDGGEKSASSGPVFKVHSPYLTYQADTFIGSSGSPVLKDYEPVALHHRAPRDDTGAAAAGSGLIGSLSSSLSCTAQRSKHSNKGILLTAILHDLEARMDKKKRTGENKSEDQEAGGASASREGGPDSATDSKLAILQRLREGAASCVARRTAGSTKDLGDEDEDGRGDGGVRQRGVASRVLGLCSGPRKEVDAEVRNDGEMMSECQREEMHMCGWRRKTGVGALVLARGSAGGGGQQRAAVA